MKTTAEEKLLRQMEKIVEEAACKMTPADFRRSLRRIHSIAQGVIRKHKRMIRLWTLMDDRMQKRAAKLTKKVKP